MFHLLVPRNARFEGAISIFTKSKTTNHSGIFLTGLANDTDVRDDDGKHK